MRKAAKSIVSLASVCDAPEFPVSDWNSPTSPRTCVRERPIAIAVSSAHATTASPADPIWFLISSAASPISSAALTTARPAASAETPITEKPTSPPSPVIAVLSFPIDV